MLYTNYLLFNNIFIQKLTPSARELEEANNLIFQSAKDWFIKTDYSSSANLTKSFLKPLLNLQSLDLIKFEADDNVWKIIAPWARAEILGLCYVVPKETPLVDEEQNQTQFMIKAVNTANTLDADIRWVILTNGKQWRLLDAKSLRKYEAYLEINLPKLFQSKDNSLATFLFYRLFRLEDAFEREEETSANKLDAFYEQSLKATEKTEKYLKTSVSDNLSLPGDSDGIMAQLCMGIVNAIDPTGKKSFDEVERDAIYRDATYLLYRLLFILYAEARNLLPTDNPDYKKIGLGQIISVSEEIVADPRKGETNPYNLWEQLTTLFNAIYYSDEYIGIPAYNGGLFDNSDKSYLSGYKIKNKFVADALYEIAFLLEVDSEVPPEKIDYRDLSVRHLGSLYEGMIEYRLFIAEEKLFARRDKNGKVMYIPASKNQQKPNDEIIEPGKVYFAQSPQERKATGTHYTHEELVERLGNQTVIRAGHRGFCRPYQCKFRGVIWGDRQRPVYVYPSGKWLPGADGPP